MAEQDLPIDIHYNKLLDWLIDRRHCDAKWLSQVRPIRERVTECLTELPVGSEQLASLREKEPINYFHCQQMFEIIKSMDGDTKSLFGKFSSPRVQGWAEVLRRYEEKSVYLAECAQLLVRNVNYEVPALKQSLSRCQQLQHDAEKREHEARVSAAALRTKFVSSCGEMGIKGESVREELQQLLSELPDIFQSTASALPRLEPVVHFYQSFVQHCTGRPVEQSQFLPMLRYIMQNGNVTVYQWKHGTAPAETSEGNGQERVVSRDDAEVEIDWGDLTPVQATDLATGQQNGATVRRNGTESIDWDAIEAVDVSGIQLVKESVAGEGQASVEAEPVTHAALECVATDREGCGAGPASCSEAELDSLLSSAMPRSLFLDDIMELRGFLSQRAQELSIERGILLGQLSSECEGLQLQDQDSVTAMLGSVTSVLDLLTNARTQHLLLMKSSARYLERMATSLLSPQLLSHRAAAQAEVMAARREEAVDTALSLQPKFAALISETRTLQSQMEEDISHRYNNRAVNIMGEINLM